MEFVAVAISADGSVQEWIMMSKSTRDCVGVLFNCKYFGLHFVAPLLK